MKNSVNKIRADVKFNTIYTCHACSKTAIGDTVAVSISCANSDELRDKLDHMPQSSRDMPVGWCSHHAPIKDFFTCDECTNVHSRILYPELY